MNTFFKFIDIDEAIRILQDIKKRNNKQKVLVCTIDFDNDKESQQIITPDEGCVLVERSKTIILNGDPFIPHMELYSVTQGNLENIIRSGTMHDIIFSG